MSQIRNYVDFKPENPQDYGKYMKLLLSWAETMAKENEKRILLLLPDDIYHFENSITNFYGKKCYMQLKRQGIDKNGCEKIDYCGIHFLIFKDELPRSISAIKTYSCIALQCLEKKLFYIEERPLISNILLVPFPSINEYPVFLKVATLYDSGSNKGSDKNEFLTDDKIIKALSKAIEATPMNMTQQLEHKSDKDCIAQNLKEIKETLNNLPNKNDLFGFLIYDYIHRDGTKGCLVENADFICNELYG